MSKKSNWDNSRGYNWWDEDDSWYSGGGFASRSRYNFSREKVNIIDPELGYFVKSDLSWAVQKNVSKLSSELQEMHKNNAIPKDIVEDIYKSYNYRSSEKVLINLEKPELAWKAKLLDKVSSYYMQGITKDNDLYSTIMTQRIHEGLLKLLHEYNKNNNDNPDSEKGLEGMLNSMGENDFETMLEQAVKSAAKDIENLDTKLNDMVGGKEASKMITDPKTLEYVDLIEEFSKIYRVNPSALSKFVTGCYKNIVNYYNAHSKAYQESLIDSEEFDGIDELEQLMPILKLSGIEDMTVLAFEHSFKFDVYIDASGSMGDTINLNGKAVSRYELARFVAIRLSSMGLINKIYLFDSRVREIPGVFELIKASWGGGTSFDAVINNIKSQALPSIILTDMCDNISEYTRNAYFIGMDLFRPSASPEVINTYQFKKQFLVFNSNGFKIPIKGVDY